MKFMPRMLPNFSVLPSAYGCLLRDKPQSMKGCILCELIQSVLSGSLGLCKREQDISLSFPISFESFGRMVHTFVLSEFLCHQPYVPLSYPKSKDALSFISFHP